MKGLGRTIAVGAFYLVAVVLLLWTATLTVSFVGRVVTSFWLVPFLALVAFDVGQVAWLLVFLKMAQGSGQRAVALLLCVLDFLGMGLLVVAELVLGGQTLTEAPAWLGSSAVWGVGAWTVANVGAVIAFHILDPDARREMALRVESDAVYDQALEMLAERRRDSSAALAAQMSEAMFGELVAGLGVTAVIPDRFRSENGRETETVS